MENGLRAALGTDALSAIKNARVLVVGAGGIGCELLKNLVLTGFVDIEVIDLDTIDISNLNRQFLFRKEHVGQSKSKVAREAVLQFNPKAKIVAHHGNVKSPEFGVEYFSRFDLVMNALDNLDARRHVNRLCLAARKPLIESGTQGYLGQVTTIRHGVTECFECQPQPAPKQYPACTIRDTPELPVHCVVWAKSIYSTLFGPPDGESLTRDLKLEVVEGQEAEYAEKLYTAYFHDRIVKQLEQKASEGRSWAPRPVPAPLPLSEALKRTGCEEKVEDSLRDQKPLSTADNAKLFLATIQRILLELKDEVGSLSFDKDDELAMDFVAAASNLRMVNYGIPTQSRFTLKGIAGNIVHAIASTNAIASGLIVLEAIKVLTGRVDECRTTWISRQRPVVLRAETLNPPNDNCYICGNRERMMQLTVNTQTFTLKQLYDRVLRKQLNMNEPSIDVVNHDNAIGTEEDHEDRPEYLQRPLADPGVKCGAGALLSVEDESQDFKCTIVVAHGELDEEKFPLGFELSGNVVTAPDVRPGDGKADKSAEEDGKEAAASNGSRKRSRAGEGEDDDDDDDVVPTPAKKRRGEGKTLKDRKDVQVEEIE